MKRRTVLARVGGLTAVGFTGCLGDGDGGDTPETDTATATETRTTTATPMPSTLRDSTIEVQDSDCGQQVSDAEIAFDGEAVVVTGTVWAPDPSWTATLADVRYDATERAMVVTVGLAQRETNGAVVQCIAEIDYRATVQFEGGLPQTVAVTHETSDGTEMVAKATHG